MKREIKNKPSLRVKRSNLFFFILILTIIPQVKINAQGYPIPFPAGIRIATAMYFVESASEVDTVLGITTTIYDTSSTNKDEYLASQQFVEEYFSKQDSVDYADKSDTSNYATNSDTTGSINMLCDNNGTPYTAINTYTTSGSGVTYPNLKISDRGAGGSDSTIFTSSGFNIFRSDGWYNQMTYHSTLIYNSGVYVRIDPMNNPNPFLLNSYYDVTSGYILDIQNQGISLFTIKKDTVIVADKLKNDTIVFGDGKIQTTSAGQYNPDSVSADADDTLKMRIYDKSGTYYDLAPVIKSDTTINITAANINDGDSIALLPVPGSGYVYEIIRITFIYSYNTSAFSGGSASNISWYQNTAIVDVYSITATLLAFTQGWSRVFSYASFLIDENSPVWIIFDSGISGGDGTAKIKVTYKKIAL